MNGRTHFPSYRLHKSSGQAVVTLPDGAGGRQDVLLGTYGTAKSRQEYARVLAEWEAAGRRGKAQGLSVNELLAVYWKHAKEYYGYGNDPRQGHDLRDAISIVKNLYGGTLAADFGPLALKACRQKMIDRDWLCTYINHQVGRLRRLFRWAAEEELLPASIYQDLMAVSGLRHGKTTARETVKVRPVAQEHVEATLPFMPPMVQAMVRFQLLTGARPNEICIIRPVDVDTRDAKCWIYRPGSDQGPHGAHKTAHHGHDRQILIGPRAQEILRPYLPIKVDAYFFSPVESEERRSARRRQERKSPMTPSQKNRRRKVGRGRAPAAFYDVSSYRNAIYRACIKAFPPPVELAQAEDETQKEYRARLTPEQREALQAWRRDHNWHPNRLRHSRATELRKHGLDVVKTILGHSRVETTQIYSEKDVQAAMELVSKIG